MNRRSLVALLLIALATMAVECPVPSPNSVGEVPPVDIPYVPDDTAKRVDSVVASPPVITQDAEGSLRVFARVAFNVDLINNSVNVLDFTEGVPELVKPMVFDSVQKDGLLFVADLTFGPDASAFDLDSSGGAERIRNLKLRVSAAYRRSPLRAISDELPLRVTAPSTVPEGDPEQIVEVEGQGAFQVNQIVVDFFDDVEGGVVESIAAGIPAEIVGFAPLTNLYVFELTTSVDDPDALTILADTIAELNGLEDLVEVATRNVEFSTEATDIGFAGNWDAAKSLAFDRAGVLAAWERLSASDVAAAGRIRIGVLDRGLQVKNFNAIGAGTDNANHPEFDFPVPLGPDGCSEPTATIATQNDFLTHCPVFVEARSPNNLWTGAQQRAWVDNIASAQAEMDHGTFVTGVIGGRNHVGAGGAVQGSLGVLAGVGVAGETATSSRPTGSELDYQVIYAHARNVGDIATNLQRLLAVSVAGSTDPAVQVVNISMGYTATTTAGGDPITCDEVASGGQLDRTQFEALRQLLLAQIKAHPELLFIASAGNCDTDARNHIPGGIVYESSAEISATDLAKGLGVGDVPSNLLTVGATETQAPVAGDRWVAPAGTTYGSNYGPSVQVSAPGVGVYGPIGLDQYTTPTATPGAAPNIGTGTGTSGATAIVSGIAGLVLGAKPGISVDELKGFLTSGTSAVFGPDGSTASTIDADIALGTAVDTTEIDVFLIADMSGSFGDDLQTFQAQASAIVTQLLQQSGRSLAIGLGTFVDYPHPEWGYPEDGDYAYQLDFPIEEMVNDGSDTYEAFNRLEAVIQGLETRFGGDGPESQLEGLYQAATGIGKGPLRDAVLETIDVAYPAAGQGGATKAFRTDSQVKIFVLWTDATFHRRGDDNGPFPYPGPFLDDQVGGEFTEPSVCGALEQAGIKVISVISAGDATLEEVRTDSAAVSLCSGTFLPADGDRIDCTGDGTIEIPGAGGERELICPISSDGTGITKAIEETVGAVVGS